MWEFQNTIYEKEYFGKKKNKKQTKPLQAFLLLSQKHKSECYNLFLQEHLQKNKFLEMLK